MSDIDTLRGLIVKLYWPEIQDCVKAYGEYRAQIGKGGADDAANLQTMCRPCNSSKGAKVLA